MEPKQDSTLIGTETKIIMVGPSGVGKTSLLASMYSHMHNEVRDMGCTFLSSPACCNELDQQRQHLEGLANGPGLRVDLDLGPKPGQQQRVFEFKLHVKPTIPDILMQFIDLPGGWYVGQGDYKAADDLIAQSQVVIVAVDAWALMEDKDKGGVGKYNMMINKPRVICEALERASTTLIGAPPIILFVLVKAEKYLHHNQAKELISTAKACYGPLIEPLKRQNYLIAACCVETIGGLELNAIHENNGRPSGTFRRLTDDYGGYNPKYCSIPLRLVFQMALSRVINKKCKSKGIQEGFMKPLVDHFEILAKFFRIDKVLSELSKKIMKHKEWQNVAERLTEKLRNEPLLVWL